MAKWWFASKSLLGPPGSPVSALIFLGAFAMSSLFLAVSADRHAVPAAAASMGPVEKQKRDDRSHTMIPIVIYD
jgi:hypothetical protein